MGRLPDSWAGRKITMRVPYEMDGELTMAASASGTQFPDATFMNNVDKPFEIHRMIPRVTALDSSGIPLSPQPDQQLLQSLVRLSITDLGKNAPLTKSATLMKLFTKGTSEQTWEYADPYYLIRSEMIQIVVDTTAFPANAAISNLSSLRIEISFQGFLVVVAAPSENR